MKKIKYFFRFLEQLTIYKKKYLAYNKNKKLCFEGVKNHKSQIYILNIESQD